MKLGAYHTLELEQQRAFTIGKVAWDALDIDRVRCVVAGRGKGQRGGAGGRGGVKGGVHLLER